MAESTGATGGATIAGVAKAARSEQTTEGGDVVGAAEMARIEGVVGGAVAIVAGAAGAGNMAEAAGAAEGEEMARAAGAARAGNVAEVVTAAGEERNFRAAGAVKVESANVPAEATKSEEPVGNENGDASSGAGGRKTLSKGAEYKETEENGGLELAKPTTPSAAENRGERPESWLPLLAVKDEGKGWEQRPGGEDKSFSGRAAAGGKATELTARGTMSWAADERAATARSESPWTAGKEGESEETTKGAEGGAGEETNGESAKGTKEGAGEEANGKLAKGTRERAGKDGGASGMARGVDEGAGRKEPSAAVARDDDGENAKDSVADESNGVTGDKGNVVRPEERVAAPTGTARHSWVDAVAGKRGLEEPRETPGASSFERMRSLPVKSNEFIVLRTVMSNKHFTKRGTL
jgi:hypothetical protein